MLADWIFLYGPPGAGKSAQGKRLARELDLPFLDLDEEIEIASGDTISGLFATQGEAAFRRIERLTLLRMLNSRPGVVALGGGTLLDRTNREQVEACGPVVCLSSSLPVLTRRLTSSATVRPLLAGDLERKLAELLDQRASHYASFPLQFNTDGLPLAQSVRQLQVCLGRFHVNGMGEGYAVRIYESSLDELGEAVQRYGLGEPISLVCDDQVANLCAQKALHSLQQMDLQAHLVIFPAGEQHKTLASVQSMWDGFLEAGLERKGTVISLGGGVVSDLAGFAAATFMRGVNWMAAPTTLLAMVDACIGGKTGFDLPQGKNLVGAFHPPRLVLVDPKALSTLPMREIRSGMAEVVKAGVVGDPVLFEDCSHGLEAVQSRWTEIIGSALAVKIQIVQNDPYEYGPRAALNFGHTIGHAVERLSNYKISHGEAVAMGMVAEARLAEGISLAPAGLAGQIAIVLTALGLPVELPAGTSPDVLLPYMQVDKKRQAGELRFALPAAIGDVRVRISLKPTDINLILASHR